MRKDMIEQYRKSVADLEITVKKADASSKSIFEKVLADGKKQLQEAEDPNNKLVLNYAKNYQQLLASNQNGHEAELKKWETTYPANHMRYVKQQLLRFMNETRDIDFSAELITKNGKKVFVNAEYEHKSDTGKWHFVPVKK